MGGADFIGETRSLVWDILHFGSSIRQINRCEGRQLVFERGQVWVLLAYNLYLKT